MAQILSSSLVSIGVPVYNSITQYQGEEVLISAIQSLQAQDYPNIEIIIVDNASTDNTWEVCQQLAEHDPRIKLYQNENNIGLHNNLSRTVALATGTYYMIASDDDYWEPTFVSKCVAQLEANPDIDLCFPLFTEYNLITHVQYPRSHMVNDSFSSGWRRALHLLTFKIRPQTMILGIFRIDAIRDLFPIEVIMNGDLLLLYEFAFRSKFKSIPEVLGKKYVRHKHNASQYSAQQITIPSFSKIASALKMIGLFYSITWRSHAPLIGKVVCSFAIIRFFIFGAIYVLTLHRVRL